MLGANPLPSNEEDTDEFNGTTTLQPVDEDSLLASSPLVGHNETVSSNGTQVEEFVCAFYNPDFIIYSSLGSFYIPCVIMVFLYIRIFSVSLKNSRASLVFLQQYVGWGLFSHLQLLSFFFLPFLDFACKG